jgi:hypothetical protein
MKNINNEKKNIIKKIEKIDFNNIYKAKWIQCRNNNDFVNENNNNNNINNKNNLNTNNIFNCNRN